MSVSYIQTTPTTPAAGTTGTSGALGALGGEQFMTLLLAQLRHQNPLEPVEDKELMGQITQLNSLQELQKMTTLLQAQSRTSGLVQGANLIGKEVVYALASGETCSAVITGVSLAANETILWAGEEGIPLSSVITISEGEN